MNARPHAPRLVKCWCRGTDQEARHPARRPAPPPFCPNDSCKHPSTVHDGDGVTEEFRCCVDGCGCEPIPLPPGEDDAPLVPHEVAHLAAQWFRVGPRLRQRCGWCGAMLVDVDLSTVAMPTEQAAAVDPDDPTCGYPTWPTGRLVAHNGAVWWLIEEGPDDPLPASSCAKLPPEATS